MRRHVIIAVIGLVLAACGSAPANSSGPTPTGTGAPPATTRASTPVEQDVMELGAPGAELAPGRYTRSGFAPPVTFELGPGWTAEQAAAGFFDVQQGAGTLDVVAVQFARVVGHETAAEAAEAVAQNATLTVIEGPDATTVGGTESIRLVVDTADPVDTQPPIFRQVLTVEAGPLSIASNRRLEVHLLDTDEGVLAVLVGGSIRGWEEAASVAAPVLASLRIGE